MDSNTPRISEVLQGLNKHRASTEADHPAGEIVWALAVDRLSDRQRRMVAAHLAICPRCGALYKDFLKGTRAFFSSQAPEAAGLPIPPIAPSGRGASAPRAVDDALHEWARRLGSPLWVLRDGARLRQFGGHPQRHTIPGQPDEVLVDMQVNPMLCHLYVALATDGVRARVAVEGAVVAGKEVLLTVEGRPAGAGRLDSSGSCYFSLRHPGVYRVRVEGGSVLNAVVTATPMRAGALLEAFELQAEALLLRSPQLIAPDAAAGSVNCMADKAMEIMGRVCRASHVSEIAATLLSGVATVGSAWENAVSAAEHGNWQQLRRWLGQIRLERSLPFDRECLTLIALTEEVGELDAQGLLSSQSGGELLHRLYSGLACAIIRERLHAALMGMEPAQGSVPTPVWSCPDRGLPVERVESLAYQVEVGRLHWQFHGDTTWPRVWERFLALGVDNERMRPFEHAMATRLPELWPKLTPEARTSLTVGIAIWWMLADAQATDWSALAVPLAHALETQSGQTRPFDALPKEADRLLCAVVERATQRGSVRRTQAEAAWQAALGLSDSGGLSDGGVLGQILRKKFGGAG